MSSEPVKIVPVNSRKERKTFLHLPWKMYRTDPYWIPPLRDNQRELVNYKKHPFYEDAEIQTFLAMRGKEPVGRIAAILNHAHNKYYKNEAPIGFFGFFESIDDQQVANGLFDAARDWLKTKGITCIRGPVNPSLNYECGLLVHGFDSSPQFMMTYNHDYYPKLLDRYGFVKSQDLYAFWGAVDMLQSIDGKILTMAEESMRRLRVRTRTLNTRRFTEDIKSFIDVYNRALPGTWGFVPMSQGEVDHVAKGLRFLIAPKLTSFAEVDGKVIGVMFGMPDYNPRIKKIDGRLFPFGFIRMLWNRQQITAIRLISTNVVPEYQRWGVGLVLMYRLVPDILEWGVREAEFSWVLESNHLSRATLERGGAKLVKTYRIYDHSGDSPAE
jgi:GNAT superfamily N-acetyltransferase